MTTNITKAAAILLLGFSSSMVLAQSDSVNISTGVISPPQSSPWGSPIIQTPGQWDAEWTCLRPGQGYQHIAVGTGWDPGSPVFSDIYSTLPNSQARILVPYPVEYGTTDPCRYPGWNNYDIAHSIPLPGSPGYCGLPGSTWTVPSGKYYFRRKISLDLPPCHGFYTAYLRIKTLAAFDYLDEIYINGHPISISDYNTITNLESAVNDPVDVYNIPINPAWLAAGPNNTLTITCYKNNTSYGTAFICDAKLMYTMWSGSAPPAVSFAGTTSHACTGSQALIKVQVTHTDPGGNNTYTAKLKAFTSGGTSSYVSSQTINGPNPVTFPITVAAAYYKMEVTSNQSGLCTGEYYVPLATNCSNSMFNPTISQSASQIFVQAIPFNSNEAALSGFMQKWTLEDLDPASLEPVYVVSEPACWSLDAGKVQTFEGFDGMQDASYEAEYKAKGNVDILCRGTAGIFKPHHIYRLTRSVKTDYTGWESYSTIIRPGAPAEFVYTANEEATGNYNVEAAPVDERTEVMTAGFEQKWKLEKLDPSSMEVTYTIDGPACWNGEAGSKTQFDNFDPTQHDYEAQDAENGEDPITVSCESSIPGVFEKNHLYRLTRWVKSDEYDWGSYSVLISPGSYEKTDGTNIASAIEQPEINAAIKNEAVTEQTMSVYPNPGNGQMIIRNSGNGVASVYDALGKKVREFELKGSTATHRIDLTELPKGIYTLNFVSNGKVSAQKLVLR